LRLRHVFGAAENFSPARSPIIGASVSVANRLPFPTNLLPRPDAAFVPARICICFQIFRTPHAALAPSELLMMYVSDPESETLSAKPAVSHFLRSTTDCDFGTRARKE